VHEVQLALLAAFTGPRGRCHAARQIRTGIENRFGTHGFATNITHFDQFMQEAKFGFRLLMQLRRHTLGGVAEPLLSAPVADRTNWTLARLPRKSRGARR
jgi:hypothetical protein